MDDLKKTIFQCGCVCEEENKEGCSVFEMSFSLYWNFSITWERLKPSILTHQDFRVLGILLSPFLRRLLPLVITLIGDPFDPEANEQMALPLLPTSHCLVSPILPVFLVLD